MCRAIKELVAAGEERGIAREKKRADSAESELRAVKQRIAELEKQLASAGNTLYRTDTM